MISNVEAATEVIKRVYKSWRFSSKKITVAEATALALQRCGLLTDVEFADLAEIELYDFTVDDLIKEQQQTRRPV